jgi:hypothetical protein
VCVGRKTRPKQKLKFKFKLKIPFLPYFTPILFSFFELLFYLLLEYRLIRGDLSLIKLTHAVLLWFACIPAFL